MMNRVMWVWMLGFALTPAWATRQERAELIVFVINVGTGDVLNDVQLTVEPGGLRLTTDLDGIASVEVPVGAYTITAAKDGFLRKIVEDVEVTADGAGPVVPLNPEGLKLENSDVVVTASADTVSQEAILAQRKNLSVLSEGIGREEMSLNPGSEASDMMQRMTGTSVVGDRYVFIRGLGERYSATQLNGSQLPSTQPDKKVVAMDLFPASLLENIQTEKTYTPDQPGEFAGGIVKINTIEFPSGPILKLSYGTAFNTNTTFKNFQNYPGGSYDFFGFDDGARRLPSIIPSERIIPATRFSAGFSPEELQRFGQAFANNWEFNSRRNAAPNQKLQVIGGNTFGNLGVVVGVFHNTDYASRDEVQRFYKIGAGDQLQVFNDYDFRLSTVSTHTSAVANIAYRFAPAHRILFRNFLTHDSSDEARQFEGFNQDFGQPLRDQRLRFEEEQIYSGQLGGEHSFRAPGAFSELLVEWSVTRARSTLDQPDLRETLYEFDDSSDRFVLADESQSGFRQFNGLAEVMWAPKVDLSLVFYNDKVTGAVKFGALYRDRNRDFSSRRFRFVPRDNRDIDLTADPNQIFIAPNISPNGFQIREETRNTDTYEATELNRSFYGMLDIAFGPWRFVGGGRVENDSRRVTTFDLFDPSVVPVATELDDADFLPALNVIYKLTENMNVRGAYSRTVNRPEFRELAPFDFTDVVGGRTVVGRPDLRRARIDNYDLRWEWYPSARDLVSAGFFYKSFDDPIERVVEFQAQFLTSFRNAESARNFGFEVDFQRSLGFLATNLENFRAGVNYTYVDSTVEIGREDIIALTSLNRPLTGQSENIFNAIFEYASPQWGTTARALINYQGDRLSDVGAIGQPDIIEEGRTSFDAVVAQPFGPSRKWGLKFSAENLLNQEVRFTQGGLGQRIYDTGRSFSISISYSFFAKE